MVEEAEGCARGVSKEHEEGERPRETDGERSVARCEEFYFLKPKHQIHMARGAPRDVLQFLLKFKGILIFLIF
jgi:hypothetical protein